ncbi:DNA repair protein RadA [bacterium]|nr:DNA repair protein RadA [bacterium]
MAKKEKIRYVCQSCGHKHLRWQGKCDNCGEWNTLIEEVVVESKVSAVKRYSSTRPIPISSVGMDNTKRISAGFKEIDRVFGGGVMPGSAILVAGEPGIGKSTLLLQSAIEMAVEGMKVLYITGEESASQVKVRAERLKHKCENNLDLLAETSAEIAAGFAADYNIVIVDSIQSMASSALESTPGNVAQVRQCASLFIEVAKKHNISVFMIGHVTKSGVIAGPRVLEHAVDVVLTLEGDRHSELRILRTSKNRFGSTGEIGVFSMASDGLIEVENPSSAFINQHKEPVPGSVVFAGLEGARPLFVEIQALASPTAYSSPQRVVQGFDPRRFMLLVAILERRAGFPLSRQDLFINVVGGVTLDERTSDLGIALAIAGSMQDIPISPKIAVFGEIGLTGELRSTSRITPRLKEAARLGFSNIIMPAGQAKLAKIEGLRILAVEDIFAAFAAAFRKQDKKREP